MLRKIAELQSKFSGITIYDAAWAAEDDTSSQVVEDFKLAWETFLLKHRQQMCWAEAVNLEKMLLFSYNRKHYENSDVRFRAIQK